MVAVGIPLSHSRLDYLRFSRKHRPMAVILPAANLPREARALLIAIAEGESDPVAAASGISPYLILVGGGSFDRMPSKQGYNGFPDWQGRQFPTGMSHASGRYQFQPGTWRNTVEMFPDGSKPDFRNFGDQDWGAWLLAQHDYKTRTGAELLPQLEFGKTGAIGGILRPTWASMSNSTFPARYKAALAAVPAEGEPETPTEKPTPATPDKDLDNALMETLIRALQINLALEGLYDGEIDGIPGAKTYQAMADYWKQRGAK